MLTHPTSKSYVFKIDMLIHFTKEFDYLISIISSRSFRLRYCAEYFGDELRNPISKAAHPMVSFSDYSDDDLVNKKITYGTFGISLDKTWAVRNKLSPVNYIERNSQAASGLIALLKARQKGLLPSHLRLAVMQLKCFTKHVYGFNSHFECDNFDFKAENEWRFVPSKSDIGGNYISLNQKTYEDNKAKYNDRLLPYSLRFLDNDIKFIYVATENQRMFIFENFHISLDKIKIFTWQNITKT
jgi:Protein of unknown function (DUF2743).